MIADSTEPADGREPAAAVPFDSDAPLARPSRLAETISFDEFAKVDLRVARVVAAEDVAGGQETAEAHARASAATTTARSLPASRAFTSPRQLVGRLVICAANLAPRKMKFGLSEGMIVAAGGGGGEIYLLVPDPLAKPGQRVHSSAELLSIDVATVPNSHNEDRKPIVVHAVNRPIVANAERR